MGGVVSCLCCRHCDKGSSDSDSVINVRRNVPSGEEPKKGTLGGSDYYSSNILQSHATPALNPFQEVIKEIQSLRDHKLQNESGLEFEKNVQNEDGSKSPNRLALIEAKYPKQNDQIFGKNLPNVIVLDSSRSRRNDYSLKELFQQERNQSNNGVFSSGSAKRGDYNPLVKNISISPLSDGLRRTVSIISFNLPEEALHTLRTSIEIEKLRSSLDALSGIRALSGESIDKIAYSNTNIGLYNSLNDPIRRSSSCTEMDTFNRIIINKVYFNESFENDDVDDAVNYLKQKSSRSRQIKEIEYDANSVSSSTTGSDSDSDTYSSLNSGYSSEYTTPDEEYEFSQKFYSNYIK